MSIYKDYTQPTVSELAYKHINADRQAINKFNNLKESLIINKLVTEREMYE
jgi:hypothetical protein